jgi:predicted ester cyclase
VSTEENKVAIRRLLEAASKGNMEALDELMTPDFYTHGDAHFPFVRGREAIKNGIVAFRTAFPDATLGVEQMFAEEDKVVTHVIVHGTNKGEWLGAAPTGNAITCTASAITRFAGGKMVELWFIEDELGIRQQLDLAPPLEQGG